MPHGANEIVSALKSVLYPASGLLHAANQYTHNPDELHSAMNSNGERTEAAYKFLALVPVKKFMEISKIPDVNERKKALKAFYTQKLIPVEGAPESFVKDALDMLDESDGPWARLAQSGIAKMVDIAVWQSYVNIFARAIYRSVLLPSRDPATRARQILPELLNEMARFLEQPNSRTVTERNRVRAVFEEFAAAVVHVFQIESDQLAGQMADPFGIDTELQQGTGASRALQRILAGTDDVVPAANPLEPWRTAINPGQHQLANQQFLQAFQNDAHRIHIQHELERVLGASLQDLISLFSLHPFDAAQLGAVAVNTQLQNQAVQNVVGGAFSGAVAAIETTPLSLVQDTAAYATNLANHVRHGGLAGMGTTVRDIEKIFTAFYKHIAFTGGAAGALQAAGAAYDAAVSIGAPVHNLQDPDDLPLAMIDPANLAANEPVFEEMTKQTVVAISRRMHDQLNQPFQYQGGGPAANQQQQLFGTLHLAKHAVTYVAQRLQYEARSAMVNGLGGSVSQALREQVLQRRLDPALRQLEPAPGVQGVLTQQGKANVRRKLAKTIELQNAQPGWLRNVLTYFFVMADIGQWAEGEILPNGEFRATKNPVDPAGVYHHLAAHAPQGSAPLETKLPGALLQIGVFWSGERGLGTGPVDVATQYVQGFLGEVVRTLWTYPSYLAAALATGVIAETMTNRGASRFGYHSFATMTTQLFRLAGRNVVTARQMATLPQFMRDFVRVARENQLDRMASMGLTMLNVFLIIQNVWDTSPQQTLSGREIARALDSMPSVFTPSPLMDRFLNAFGNPNPQSEAYKKMEAVRELNSRYSLNPNINPMKKDNAENRRPKPRDWVYFPLYQGYRTGTASLESHTDFNRLLSLASKANKLYKNGDNSKIFPVVGGLSHKNLDARGVTSLFVQTNINAIGADLGMTDRNTKDQNPMPVSTEDEKENQEVLEFQVEAHVENIADTPNPEIEPSGWEYRAKDEL